MDNRAYESGVAEVRTFRSLIRAVLCLTFLRAVAPHPLPQENVNRPVYVGVECVVKSAEPQEFRLSVWCPNADKTYRIIHHWA